MAPPSGSKESAKTLSSKDQTLFRQVVKNYEAKQYKKGLKAAEQILRKNPTHGETQAMKALIINALGQKDEAFELAKSALKNAMKSNTCWHAYGLLWRSHKNFEEAIKAYKFALKLEPDSPQILRDLALLQMQMRDYPGYMTSRANMLQQQPGWRQNWTAMAVAHHLNGELERAEKVLTTYEETLKSPPPKTDVEHCEATLYKNTVIAEMGQTQRALDHLEAIQKHMLDRLYVLEKRAEYLLQLDRKEAAADAYRALIDRNPELRAYYTGLERALGLTHTDTKELKDLYESIAQKHNKADAAKRIPLDFLQGDDFRAACDDYLRKRLVKGVPSLFSNVKALYANEMKRKTIQELVESYSVEKQVNGHVESEKEDTFREAVLFYLAQHYNYKLSRNLSRSLELTKQLQKMSPKTYDYLMLEARILKHHGNPSTAAEVMDRARELDLKDRYINTKCARYQLRNDDNDTALKTMSKFTRNEAFGGTLGDLQDMQSINFLTEDGESYLRQRKLGLALKRFHAVYDAFDQWQEDQFDFHSYSFRKGQIRAYIRMIRFEDSLRDHPFYARAAVNAIRTYILLQDNPKLALQDSTPDLNNLDEVERKKALKKARKEQERLEKEEEERKEADKKAAAKRGNLDAEGMVKKTDPDPRGLKLLETTEPLETALKFLNPLMEFGQRDSEAQHIGFEVYIRRKKYFLALKCLLLAFKIDSSDPVAHEQTIRFRHSLNQDSSLPTASAILELANSELPALYNDDKTSLSSVNDCFILQNPKNAQHRLAYIRARHAINDASTADLGEIPRVLDVCDSVTLDDALAALETLKQLGATNEILTGFLAKAKGIWPEATILQREADR